MKKIHSALPSPRWARAQILRLLPFVILLGLFVSIAAIALPSCRSSAPTDPNGDMSVALDAVPLLLKADSVSTATIWATVLEHGHPVPDSTLVSLVASHGTIAPEQAYTRDGLATAVFTPILEAGVAVIVAQVRAMRDTVEITVY